jgi:predicted membrane protein
MEQSIAIIDDKKKEMTERLSFQYSLNKISLREYEKLTEYINKIQTDSEVKIFEKTIWIYEHDLLETENKPIKNYYTILSYKKTPGSIINEIDGKIITVLGENHIIINEEDLSKEENVIHVKVVLGEMVIHIPESVIIINEAVSKIGGEIIIKDKYIKKKKDKFLIIRGEAILGYLTVKIKE